MTPASSNHSGKPFHRLQRLLLLAWVGSSVALAQAQTQTADIRNFIVTDIDDTVKLTDVNHLTDAIVRSVFGRKAFAGMSTLYREISERNDRSTLFFVTGSPRIFRKPLVEMIVANKFPAPWMLSLRDLSKSTPEFKVARITEILQGLPPEGKLILVGDDGENDPETYATLLAQNPGRIAGVYIHRIQNRVLPAGEFAYDTAMDIAVSEMEKGRLSAEQVMRVGNAVLAESQGDDERLALNYCYCPLSLDPVHNVGSQSDAAELNARIRQRLVQICQDRKSAKETEELRQNE
jgi:hypothetical protein